MKTMHRISQVPWLLAVVLACVLGSATVFHAQESAKPAQPGHDATQSNNDQGTGVGAELAKETREAAGEDEASTFKKSSAVQWLAKLTGGNVDRAYWLAVLLNFVVVFLVLFWAAKKYLPGAFRARTESIQRAMEEARRASEDANRRLSEIELRLSKLGDEIKAMTATADREIGEEEARSKAVAEEETRRIVEAAEQEIDAAAKTARRDLTQYAADLAVTLAQRQIHVDESTDQALVRQFTNRIAGEGSKN